MQRSLAAIIFLLALGVLSFNNKAENISGSSYYEFVSDNNSDALTLVKEKTNDSNYEYVPEEGMSDDLTLIKETHN